MLFRSHMYSESYLPPSIAYANRLAYANLPYSVPEGMSLPHMTMQGKGPVYPHPVLMGNSSLYPPRLTPKHGLPYGIPPNHGDYLTYHDSKEMVHPLMVSHLGMDAKERLDLRSRPQEKPWSHDGSPYRNQMASDTESPRKNEKEINLATGQDSKLPSKPFTGGKEEIVCIDLLQSDMDSDSSMSKHSSPSVRRRYPGKQLGCESSYSASDRREPEPLRTSQVAEHRLGDPEKQLEQRCLPRPLDPHKGFPSHPNPSRPEAPMSPYHCEDSPSPAEGSPLPDLPEEQTLRCARTSGERPIKDRGPWNRSSGERAYGDPTDESRIARVQPCENRALEDRASGNRNVGGRAFENRVLGDRSCENHEDRTCGVNSSGDGNSGDQPFRDPENRSHRDYSFEHRPSDYNRNGDCTGQNQTLAKPGLKAELISEDQLNHYEDLKY